MLKVLSACNIFFIDLYRDYNEGERENLVIFISIFSTDVRMRNIKVFNLSRDI